MMVRRCVRGVKQRAEGSSLEERRYIEERPYIVLIVALLQPSCCICCRFAPTLTSLPSVMMRGSFLDITAATVFRTTNIPVTLTFITVAKSETG